MLTVDSQSPELTKCLLFTLQSQVILFTRYLQVSTHWHSKKYQRYFPQLDVCSLHRQRAFHRSRWNRNINKPRCPGEASEQECQTPPLLSVTDTSIPMGHCWWPQLLITCWASDDLSPLNSFCVEDSQLAAQLPFPPTMYHYPRASKPKQENRLSMWEQS